MVQPLLLASASPRRRALLRLLTDDFAARAFDVDETPAPGEAAASLAERLARVKAEAARRVAGDRLILAADTVVAHRGAPLGKPVDRSDALRMLLELRGRTHQVITAVALIAPGGCVYHESVSSDVTMRDYDREEIERFVDSGRAADKAGAYAIQDAEFRPVAAMAGCYPNVVGLPLCAVARGLLVCGLDSPLIRFFGPPEACGLCDRARALEW
ncbi:MAG: Maf family protein [Chloroflexota bacterium]